MPCSCLRPRTTEAPQPRGFRNVCLSAETLLDDWYTDAAVCCRLPPSALNGGHFGGEAPGLLPSGRLWLPRSCQRAGG